jgi:hypothetical protein
MQKKKTPSPPIEQSTLETTPQEVQYPTMDVRGTLDEFPVTSIPTSQPIRVLMTNSEVSGIKRQTCTDAILIPH